MINLTLLSSAAHAESYYDHDDYYSESGEAPSRWQGSGAAALGLAGEVSREELHDMLEGELPDGTRLGVQRNGEWQHRPGHDATLSAPKSVSTAALVGGDDRLIKAHDEAVAEALSWLEENAAQTRIREDGEVSTERTGNLAAATFRHATNRNQDPQLHTHCLLINATQDSEGRWRSLDSKELYRVQHAANEVYMQSLARRAQELGYTVEQSEHGFELGEVPDEVREAFSSRRAAVDAWLEAHGYDRETASAEIRERATLATRARKEKGVDRGALAQRWRDRGTALGYDAEAAVRSAKQREVNPQEIASAAAERAAAAVATAAGSLGERKSRFTSVELEREALRSARGSAATHHEIREAIREAEVGGELKRRTVETDAGGEQGYTTQEAIRTERAMLAIERAGRGAAGPLADRDAARRSIEKAAESSPHGWTRGQREAAQGLLTSESRVAAVQGYAGTAKTTTVLRTVAEEAEAAGYVVRGMAPTRSAADQLAEGAQLGDANTVASHLAQQRSGAIEGEDRPELWLVDEASMLSAKDMRDLLRAAERKEARVAMVGDVQQLGSVEAGEAFRQLQERGMETYVLDEVVRQRDDDTRAAVYSSIEGDVAGAMRHIERSGEIREERDAARRREAIAEGYLALSAEERAEALVLDPTRSGRRALNERIRQGLRAEGRLQGEEARVESLEKKDMTSEESQDASRYEAGDLVRFARDYRKAGIEADTYYRVAGVDYAERTVRLEDSEGNELRWQPHRFGGGRQSEVYQAEAVGVAAGDELQWSRNDRERGLANGDRLTVEAVEGSEILARDARGREHRLDAQERDSQHWRHAYAVTVHAAQGRTASTVFAHLAGEDRHLLDQRSYYTAISRAKDRVQLYTDDRDDVERIIGARSGVRQTALEDSIRTAEREAEQTLEEYFGPEEEAAPELEEEPEKRRGFGRELERVLEREYGES